MRSFARAVCFGAAVLLPTAAVAQRRGGAPEPEAGRPRPHVTSPADTFIINSRILAQPRRIFVSVPASHALTTRAYPVIIVLDGEANFTPATTITTTLASLGHIPEAIVVAIPNVSSNPLDRVRDMTPPGLSVSGSSLNEGGDRFLDFIEQVVAALDDNIRPAIVFVTAYDQYAIRAFEVDAVDYLLKPITQQRLDAAVERVLGRVQHGATLQRVRALAARMNERGGYATRFVARRGGKHYFVRVADVDWLESNGNYIRIHTGESSHLIREPMKDLETRLDPAHFVRIHRSIMVAIDHIRSIETGEHGEYVLTLPGGRRLVSSRGFSERVRRLLR